MGDIVATASSAVASLYSGGVSEAERRRADAWLKDLVPSTDAWSVAHAFLSSLPAPGDALGEQRAFFGAHLFLTKLRADFGQLPAASLGSLKGALPR